VLIDCVEGGASVSFMLPMTRAKAETFWRNAAAGVARGERVVLSAEDETGIVGTVQIILAQPENQPHRGDLAKMLVHRRARAPRHRRGPAWSRRSAARSTRARPCWCSTPPPTTPSGSTPGKAGSAAGSFPTTLCFPDGRPCATTYFFKSLRD
jgi:hypothetical protein